MIKQIAGRAGRRSSRFPRGEVTCYKGEDMEFLRQGLILIFNSLPTALSWLVSNFFESFLLTASVHTRLP